MGPTEKVALTSEGKLQTGMLQLAIRSPLKPLLFFPLRFVIVPHFTFSFLTVYQQPPTANIKFLPCENEGP